MCVLFCLVLLDTLLMGADFKGRLPMQTAQVAFGAAQSTAVPSANDLVGDEIMDVQPTGVLVS